MSLRDAIAMEYGIPDAEASRITGFTEAEMRKSAAGLAEGHLLLAALGEGQARTEETVRRITGRRPIPTTPDELRADVAESAQLPEGMAARLKGETRQELEQDADLLRGAIEVPHGAGR